MTISDINTWARFLVDASTVSYPDASLLIAVNVAYEDVVSKILSADGRWEFDDSGYTSQPIATTTLVASQQDYTFDVSHLKILRVSVLSAGSIWNELEPIDFIDIPGDPSEFYKTPGMPVLYDKQGSSLLLYPSPAAANVTLASGLKVYFQRTSDNFSAAQVTTGSKTPGFASPFHVLLSYKAALVYAQAYKKDRVQIIMSEIARLETAMLAFYSKRSKDERARFTISTNNNRLSANSTSGVLGYFGRDSNR